MSRARETFEVSIRDAEILLSHFDALPKPPPQNAEVLKRAGLVMALTAWETFVEDLVQERVLASLQATGGNHASKFMLTRLDEDLKRFNNPTWDKTRKIFLDYLDVDVTTHWRWAGYDPDSAKRKLNELLGTRGDIVHRSKAPDPSGPPKPHPVKREDLAKAIRFLKRLADVTDNAFAESLAAN
jgi:hypothetical protein